MKPLLHFVNTKIFLRSINFFWILMLAILKDIMFSLIHLMTITTSAVQLTYSTLTNTILNMRFIHIDYDQWTICKGKLIPDGNASRETWQTLNFRDSLLWWVWGYLNFHELIGTLMQAEQKVTCQVILQVENYPKYIL